jgi:hypothetical protein
MSKLAKYYCIKSASKTHPYISEKNIYEILLDAPHLINKYVVLYEPCGTMRMFSINELDLLIKNGVLQELSKDELIIKDIIE